MRAKKNPGEGGNQGESWAFGPFRFQPATGELTDGRRTWRLAPQPATVLHRLLAGAGQLVTREELYTAVWGDRHVDAEHGLNFCVRQLRRVLEDSARSPRFIETVRGRGYRFVAPVQRVDLSVDHLRPRRRALVALGALAAATVAGLLAWGSWWQLAPLPIRVDPAESSALVTSAGSPALDDYIAGRFLLGRGDHPSIDRGIARLQQAVELDPDFLPAHVALARSYGAAAQHGIDAPASYEHARQAAQHALAIDPDEPDALLVLAVAELYLTLDWEHAHSWFERAAGAAPDSAPAQLWHARSLAGAGRVDEAIEGARRALALDPEYGEAMGDLGWFYYLAERWSDAAEVCRQVLELEPDSFSALRCLAVTEAIRGNESAAVAATWRLERLVLGETDLTAPPPETPLAFGDALLRMAQLMDDGSASNLLALEQAQFLALAGDSAAALDRLRHGLHRRLPWAPFVHIDPAFATLREDPRYRALLATVVEPA